MSRCIFDITVSLDGYITAPGAGIEHGLGIGGEPLHDWAVAPTEQDARLLDETVAATGAVLMGRRTFDIIDSPYGWSDETGYGAKRDQSGAPPNFVVTSTKPERTRMSGFTFVTDGIVSALQQARAAAGDRDVVIMGGANLGRQYLAAGLLDELHLHVAPIVLGGGTPLFVPDGRPRQFEQLRAVSTARAHHLTYRVLPAPG